MDSAGRFILKSDRIYFSDKKGERILHWGIYDGQGNIIHVTSSSNHVIQNERDAIHENGLNVESEAHEITRNERSEIHENGVEEDTTVKREPLHIIAAGKSFFKSNEVTSHRELFPGDEIVRRAMKMVGKRFRSSNDSTGSRDSTGSIGEQFVNWCCYGVAESLQTDAGCLV